MTKISTEIEDQLSKLRFRQLVTALGPLLGSIVSGMVSGYSAVLLPQLKASVSLNIDNSSVTLNNTNEIRVFTLEDESWIASAAVILMAPGCWLAGLLMEKLGRRLSLLLLFPVLFVGWLIVGLANSFSSLIIGRLICGLCVGLLGPLTAVYISETADPSLRGILLGAMSSGISLGVFIVHAIGTWLHWRSTVYICSILPIICWLISFAARESPTWLLNQGLHERARETWIYFRGRNSMDEYFSLENSQTQGSKDRLQEATIFSSVRSAWSSRNFTQPLGILCLFFFVAQFSGINAVVFYSVGMVADVTGPENAYWGSLVIDIIRLSFSVWTCYLIKRCNRRTLTFVSGFGTAIVLLSLSLSLYLVVGQPWLPAIFLVVYTIFLTIGLIPLPWMLCGELFPRKFRGLGSGLTSGFTFMCFFVVVKMAPCMFEFLRPHGTFAIYGGVALFGTSFLYLTLPETRNKTLQEIEGGFQKKLIKNIRNIDGLIV